MTLAHRIASAAFAAVFIIVAALAAGPISSASALDEGGGNAFSVSGIAVDVTEKTAAAARAKAIVDAQDAAFNKLVRRLVVDGERGKLPALNSKAVTDLVQDVSVQQEKSSAVRYLATMTVTFKAESVRRLFKTHGVSFTEVVSKPVLVIPLYQRAASAPVELWEESNVWRAAWLDRKEDDGLVPLVVPLGDLQDMKRLTADAAARADAGALRAIADRYGVKGVLVAHAVLTSAHPPIIELTLTRTGSAMQEQVTVKTLAGAEGDSVQNLLAQAMTATAEQGAENWKRDNQMRFGQSGQVTLLAPLTGLADLVRLRAALKDSPLVTDHVVQAVKRDLAQIAVNYNGDPQQLAVALEQRDLIVDRSAAVWTVRFSGASPIPAVPTTPPAAPAPAPAPFSSSDNPFAAPPPAPPVR